MHGTHSGAFPNSEAKTQLARLVGITRILAITGAVGIGIAVFFGLRGVLAAEGGLVGWIVPIAFAAVLTALMAGLWHIVLGTTVSVDVTNSQKFWTVTSLGALLFAIHMATSMPFLASAIGGLDAIRYDKERVIEQMTRATNVIALNAEYYGRVNGAIASERQSLEDLLVREIAGRGPSGQIGDGPMAGIISAGINLISGTSERTQVATGNLGTLLKTVRAHLASARQAARINDEQAFVTTLSNARTALVEAKGAQGADLLQGFDLSGSGLAELRLTEARIRAAARSMPAGLGDTDMPEYVTLSRPRAVITYPEAVPLAWSVAFAADSLPFVLLIVLVLIVRMQSMPSGPQRYEHWPEPDETQEHRAQAVDSHDTPTLVADQDYREA